MRHSEEYEVVLEPWHLLLLILAGWINQRQQDAIEYLRMENLILERSSAKRILLDDDQRAPFGRVYYGSSM
jgi:hypothetical protein